MKESQEISCRYWVTTIKAAMERWGNNDDNPLHALLCRQMVDWIANPDNEVTGDAADYYCLVSAAFKSSDYLSAVRIAELGLAKYPYDLNLLALAVRVSGRAGDFGKGEAFLAQMERIDRKYWDWNAYRYAIEMLRAEIGQTVGPEREQLIARALQMCDDYIAAFPAKDRAYNSKAEVLIAINRLEDAKQVLQNAIFNAVVGDKPILAPQCCITYLEHLLAESNDYDLIIKVATKGLVATATDEDSAHFGYFVYRIALAKDAQVVSSGFDNRDRILDALSWYQNAYDNAAVDTHRENIARRYLFIRQNSKYPNDQPLIEHEHTLPDPEKLRSAFLAAKKIQEESEE